MITNDVFSSFAGLFSRHSPDQIYSSTQNRHESPLDSGFLHADSGFLSKFWNLCNFKREQSIVPVNFLPSMMKMSDVLPAMFLAAEHFQCRKQIFLSLCMIFVSVWSSLYCPVPYKYWDWFNSISKQNRNQNQNDTRHSVDNLRLTYYACVDSSLCSINVVANTQ